MASEAVANGTSSAVGDLTPAQRLMQEHDHHATVEDTVDEEDIVHPPPSAASKAETSTSAAPAATMSEKAAGKQKAEDPAAPASKAPLANVGLNTASEELFPALGPVKPRAAAAAPTWGKKPASLAPNGTNGHGLAASNNTSRASTPASGPPAGGRGPGAMAIPGKDSDKIMFYPAELIPRNQLKKPLNEIIRDINKRSKAKLEVRLGGPGGMVTFEATGPKDAVRQALKDIANEVGAKVRTCLLVQGGHLVFYTNQSTTLSPTSLLISSD